MSVETILPTSREAIAERSKQNQEPQWLHDLRLEALEQAGLLEWPKLEKTNISRWNLQAYGDYKAVNKVSSIDELPTSVKQFLQEDQDVQNLVVQRNSGVVFNALAAELAEQGVIFTDLQTAVSEHSDLVKPYLMQAVKKDENRITALHTALWSGGVFIYIPRNVKIEIPLQALFLTDDASASFAPHVLIVAEDNSSVTYVDNYFSGESTQELVHNGIVEIFAKPGAHVRFASIHNLGDSVTDLSYRRAIIENDARMEWVIGEMNNGNCLSDTYSVLKGNGSNSDAKVICVGAKAQKLNLTTRAVHFGRSSNSDMSTRAVMKDEATAIINGITKIEKGATNANGEQTEKVLMLSPKARGDANPMLLIDEDEVTAGHAASVGQVDKNQLYYLMSRGISRDKAEKLIIYGFMAPVVSQIPIEKIEKQLQQLIERKLGE
jgi:Fe-S cluster assembly protein SufD